MKKYAKTITTLMIVLVSIVSFSQAQADENKTLTTKEKGIIPIAAFTATGNLPQLETALTEGLNAGLTINEIKEILVHSYPYNDSYGSLTTSLSRFFLCDKYALWFRCWIQPIWSNKESRVWRFIGSSSLIKTLSCDSVMDGAFFSQPDFQVPEEEMCHHAR